MRIDRPSIDHRTSLAHANTAIAAGTPLQLVSAYAGSRRQSLSDPSVPGSHAIEKRSRVAQPGPTISQEHAQPGTV